MTHSVDDIAVTLKRIIHVELRPTLIIQYLSHYVVERTTVEFYVCTAVVPRATMISQCKIKPRCEFTIITSIKYCSDENSNSGPLQKTSMASVLAFPLPKSSAIDMQQVY